MNTTTHTYRNFSTFFFLFLFCLTGCSNGDSVTTEAIRNDLSGYENITATFTQGVATLSGNVADKKDRQAIMDLTRNVPGVRAVNGNRLQVRAVLPAPAKEKISDEMVTAAVKHRQLTQKELSTLDIGVATSEGVVTLTGFVSHSSQIRLAEIIARETDGVKKIINYLSVKM